MPGALFLYDAVQGVIDVEGQAAGVAAHVEVGALLEPGPDLGGDFFHPVLDVHLLLLIAREGRVQAGEYATVLVVLQLLLIKEVEIPSLFAEEEPVFSPGSLGRSLFEKGPERRDAGPGPDHDDRRIAAGRQAEAVGGMDEDANPLPRAYQFRQVRGGHLFPHPVGLGKAHHANRQMGLLRMGPEGGRDRIEARLQRRHQCAMAREQHRGDGTCRQ
jgi:hypothetical protein